MVAADDEMRAAIVLADDRVPERLARSRHPHRKVQQAECRRLLRVVLQHVLVAAHARVVIHVAGARHSDHGVNEQVRFRVARGTQRQLVVRTMHRIAGLERHHLAPSQLAEAARSSAGESRSSLKS
jgi:hypothetical protein